jgi:putative nucleotidyltransferase with HDIG domain
MQLKLSDSTAVGHFVSLHELGDEEIGLIFRRPLYRDVIASEAFKRLREIRFLGAIDYALPVKALRPKRWHSRYQHSLGVAQLALEYARARNLRDGEEELLVTAALLHDIGHAPLSHSLESAFLERFGIEHHEATEFIVRGNGPLGYPLLQVLRRYSVRPEDILSLVEDGSASDLADIFRYPINVDTIEGILRCYSFFATGGPPAQKVLQGFLERDVIVLDQFWEIKDLVYGKLIGSELGVLADFICRSYMQSAKEAFWKGEYFQTEIALRKRHPELFAQLRDLRVAPYKIPIARGTAIHYKKRHFFVDQSKPLRSYKDLPLRYLQSKTEATLVVGGLWT